MKARGICVVSKSSVNGRVIKAVLENKLPFYSVKKIISLIEGEVKEVSVNVAIQTLTKRGILKKEERGIYTLALDNNSVVKLEEKEQEYRIINSELAEESEKNRRKNKVLKAIDDLENYFNEEGIEGVSDYFETIRCEVNKKFGVIPEETSSEETSSEEEPSENQLPEPPAEIPIVGFNEATTFTEETASDNEEENVSEPSNDEKDDTENRQAEIHFPE